MFFLKSLFDETFVHMTVGFLGMLVAAVIVIGVSGAVARNAQNSPQSASVRTL